MCHPRLVASGLLLFSTALSGCGGTKPVHAEDRAAIPASADEAPTDSTGAGEWRLPGRDPEGTRYSPLDQITTDNAGKLEVAWTFSTGVLHGHEGQPLVVGSTMYLVTPFPNIVYALDLANPTGPAKWIYKPNPDPASQGEACCDIVNRGASYGAGKIVFNTLDNHTIALDANSGKVAWSVKMGDINLGETTTMAPLIIGDRVITGISGAEMGVRGRLVALDLGTGKELWRAWSTGPDSDILLAPGFKAFYPGDRGTDLGVKTWPPDQWKIGGGTTWGWVTYDPGLDLLYYGTANPGVWNADMRPGDNKWSMTIFARHPADGRAVWAYQLTPHDAWDYDAVNESIPVELTIGGTPRKVVVHFDRNGFAYTIDRTTGEVLVVQPFQYVNWARGIDLKTGRPIEDPDKRTKQGENTTNICPAATGGRDQQPAAWSPRTHLFYTPTTHLCMDYKGVETSYIAGTPYVGAEVMMYAGPGGNRGEFIAWDPVAGKKAWGIKERFPIWTGALVTAGDVVFYGTMDGWVKAVNGRSGAVLWSFKTGSGVIGNFMSYRGPDGKQYVAVYTGVGGWAGATAFGISPDDPTAALGFANAMKDLPKYTAPGGMLYVFALP
jgi:PQQ-dependent dehydrogenase (methanol/ethanol family)